MRKTTKVCTKCKITKPVEDFYKRKNGRRPHCKMCETDDQREIHQKFSKREEILIPETKLCPSCQIEKINTDFNKIKTHRDGLDIYCKDCKSKKAKERRKRRCEKEYIKIPETKKCGKCKTIKSNTEFVKDKGTPTGLASICRLCSNEVIKNWTKNNRQKIRDWSKLRRQKNPQERLSGSLRHRINMFLKGKTLKSARTEQIIGCSFDECKTHLESLFWPGMSWENYGKGGWVVDHIVPLINFDVTDERQRRLGFNYKNLQPLWEDDNRTKWDRNNWTPLESTHPLPERFKVIPPFQPLIALLTL